MHQQGSILSGNFAMADGRENKDQALLERILQELRLKACTRLSSQDSTDASPSNGTESPVSSWASPILSWSTPVKAPILPLAELLPLAPARRCETWRIVNPGAKFKASCGFPLVSPQFSNDLLEDFRVIFAPGSAWKGRKPKESPQASRFGSLQLKFLLGEDNGTELQIFFTVGGGGVASRLGPFKASSRHSVSEICELPVDWRTQEHSVLTIGVEIVAA
ncbi:unnamed protein product [Effrenium voratum]|uniref:Uncharacterized protein n=1 Tax=Effrenium voratum TaxID=2562239 RepID=A0AA36MQ26_9DINO|nr:unnamed protein product [Effrenium voratum]CAJ1440536.1 unnamed protein product [Effrenium voratum]